MRLKRSLDHLNPYSAGISAIELVTLLCYVDEHEPTRKEACAKMDISHAKFKRMLDVARFLGVDVRAVNRKNSAETYYAIKHFGIFSKPRMLEMREHF